MEWLISKIIILGIASAIAPMVFTASVLLISDENSPRRKLAAFLAGGALVAIIIAFLAVQVWDGNIIPAESKSTNLSGGKGTISLVLGALMLITGAYLLLSPKKSELKINLPSNIPVLFGFGVFLYITNFKAILINLVAMREILDSNIVFSQKLLYFGIFDTLYLLPSLFPLLVHILAKDDAEKFIIPVRNFFQKHGTVMLAIICMAFGLFMFV